MCIMRMNVQVIASKRFMTGPFGMEWGTMLVGEKSNAGANVLKSEPGINR